MLLLVCCRMKSVVDEELCWFPVLLDTSPELIPLMASWHELIDWITLPICWNGDQCEHS